MFHNEAIPLLLSAVLICYNLAGQVEKAQCVVQGGLAYQEKEGDMKPYEISYKLGNYQSSVVVQAVSADEAAHKARERGYIPRLAGVLSVKEAS